jgi:hypothetical protein
MKVLDEGERVHCENLLTLLNKAEFNKLHTSEIVLMNRCLNWLGRMLDPPKPDLKVKKVRTNVGTKSK